MYNTLEIANRIKLQAKACDKSVGSVLEECELGKNTVGKMAKGKDILTLNFAKIADALECSVDYLLGRTDDPKCHLKQSIADVDALELEQRIEQKETPASIAEAK